MYIDEKDITRHIGNFTAQLNFYAAYVFYDFYKNNPKKINYNQKDRRFEITSSFKNLVKALLTNRTLSYLPDCSKSKYIYTIKGKYSLRTLNAFELTDWFIFYLSTMSIIDKLASSYCPNTFFFPLPKGSEYLKLIQTDSIVQDDAQGTGSSNPYEIAFRLYYFKLDKILKGMHHIRRAHKLGMGFFTANPNGIIISVDIANFFDSIRLSTLHKKLYDIMGDDDRIYIIQKFLSHWDRHYPERAEGLPQELIGISSALAHFYLQGLDNYIIGKALDQYLGVCYSIT